MEHSEGQLRAWPIGLAVEDGEEEEYSIVGSQEADPSNNKISNESPIAKAIMGKKVKDVVSVESPAGKYEVRIKKISC